MRCLGSLCYLCNLSVNLKSFYKVLIKNVFLIICLFWLVFVATRGLSLVAMSGVYSLVAF